MSNVSLRTTALFWGAQLLVFFRQHERALELLQEVVREDPAHRSAWNVSGFLLAEKQRLDEAIRALERANELQSGDAACLFNLGFVLQRARRHEEAIERFRQAREIDPTLDRAWYGAGISLIHCGRYREALETLNEAAKLQPFNPYARYQLAAAWFKLGEREEVQAEYRRVKAFDPKVAEHICEDFGATPEPE